MKSRYLSGILLLICGIVLVSCLGLVLINRTDGIQELKLDEFSSDSEYKYKGIDWRISEKELKQLMPLEKEMEMQNAILLVSKNKYTLDGKNTVARMAFQNDELVNVTFQFHLHDDYEEWFNEQLDKLVMIYGKESEILKSIPGDRESVVYKWDTDTSSLQLILTTDKSGENTATLGVMVK